MKFYKFTFAILLSLTILSCSSDDDTTTEDLTSQTGNLVLKFDNGVGDQDFIFGTTYNKSNGESYKLNTLKYIISNVKVTDQEGNTFTYPYEENVFIIDEAASNNAGEVWITLNDVDAANYTSISFGIGIDQERYALGAEGQGDFLTEASDAGMMWSWATGFRFTRFDGTYSSPTATDVALNIHMGSVGTALDNYREVTLDFPNTVRVREASNPEVHIKADIARVFDNTTSINLSDGYDQVHTNATTTAVIADHMSTIFSVHHVHNE
ncbi:MAG: MbnP family protein [Bacteroidota bacterium]